METNDFAENFQGRLDPTKLENVKHLDGGAIRAACPACRAVGSDKSGDHLLIQPSGKFGCAANPGDREHRREIFRLAGIKSAPTPAPNAGGKRIVATYNYQDASGKVVFQVVRYQPKDFRQRRPDGKGGWIWDTDGVEKVLFRLPEIIRAVSRGTPIFLCEGEKDCLSMVQRGFDATCNPGGAAKKADGEKWLTAYTETLHGADVCIVADKDADGRKHAQIVAGKLHGVAKSVRVIELPDTNGKTVKDAFDFFAAGGDTGKIFELVDTMPDWKPAAPVADSNRADVAREYLGEEAETKPADLPPIIDAADFLATLIEAPAELVAGILHKGSKLAFGGSSKAYKTWSLLDLAISVAHGQPWLGFDTQPGKVLFVNFEIQPHAWQRRIAAMCRAKGIELKPGAIQLLNLRGHAADFRSLIPRIIERCRAENFALIILDPIYKLYGGTDENAAGDVAALLNSLERLAVETGAAVAYGCHFAKGNAAGKEALDRISGSGVFARDPDSLLIFTKHEEPDAFSVEPILRNFAPVEAFAVRWQFPLMQRDDDLDPAKLKQVAGRKPENSPDDLLKVLPADGLTNADFLAAADADGISKRTFYRLRKSLESAGKIMLSKVSGKWTPILTNAKPTNQELIG